MRVQEDWDRPRGGGSYYPPLRFPDALEKPAGEDPRLPGTLGGLGRPPAPAGGAFGGGGGAFGSGAFGGGAFGNGAFGGGAFGGSSSSTNGCAGRNGAFDSAIAGAGGLPPTPAGPSAGLRSPGGDMSSGLHTSAGDANGRPAGAMVNSTFTVLQRETSSSLASNGLNYSSGGACASSKMSQRHDPFASTDAPSGNGCMSQGPGGHDRYAHAGISGGAFSDSPAGVPRGSVREDDRAPVAPSAFDDRDGRYGASVQRYSPHENGSRDGFAAGPGGAPRSEPSGSSYGAFGSSMGGGGLPNGRSALDSGVAASAAPNGSAGFRGYDAGSQDRGAAGTSAASYAGRDVDDGFGAPFGRSAASPEPLRPALADPLPPRPPGGRAPEEAAGGAPLEQEVEVRASGTVPGRWRSWDDVGFPARVRSPLITAGFPAPTLIQQYAWPICFLGRDLIGIAKTGSGKTLAFLLPAFARLLNSHADPRGPPAILVMAPTRELACQIEQEAKQFGEMAGMRATCLYGGAPKGPQLAELRGRPQVLVATPGRLNDLLEPPAGLSVAVDIKGIQYLVLDEADRMLDMGFEPQIRKIIRGLPQERQTLMFTATWPAAVRRLAMEFMREAVEVRVGEADELRVNPDVEQSVIICSDYREKEDRLVSILREGGDDQAIIFVNTKRMCESVALRTDNSVVIHGDKDQRERDQALGLFKSGSRRILVATDVAARGLDIKSVRLVVNFDPPNREEDYVHRVGRTGRAGLKGRAITLLTNDDGGAARSIVEIYKRMGLPVPEELERRLASGEMRQGGGRGGRDGGGRDGPRRLGGGLGGGRRGLGGDMGFGDDDFDNMGGSRFSGGFGAGRRDDDFPGFCLNDCPT